MKKDVTEIFQRAGVTIEGNEVWAKKCEQILGDTMAKLSVLCGLSKSRIREYDAQKQQLVDDLLEMKAAGELK